MSEARHEAGAESWKNTVQAVVLDIEGTTTPITFVTERLFPFARQRAREYLSEHWPAHVEQLHVARSEVAENGADPPSLAQYEPAATPEALDALTRFVHWMMDRDMKVTALKALQGDVWVSGYKSGELQGEIYDDVLPCMKSWKEQGKDLYIYSSGSVAAQKLLFGHTRHGDLCGMFNGHFDTQIGGKREASSYERLARDVGLPPNKILFLTDVFEEAEAAATAGINVGILVRPGNKPLPDSNPHVTFKSFQQIEL